jgi:predicted nucleotidyltransferase
MREDILARLRDAENSEGIRILYACEAGSRAWGFPSADSDYDVRFVYLHPRDWYLSIDLETKRDVIECPLVSQLDINGWDLRKALRLLRKGNPPLMEWLGSPVIYREEPTVIARLRDLASEYYSPVAALYHYLHMARGNYREYLKGPTVWLKKYFYVLRPLLAIRWIEQGLGPVPTEFHVLAARVIDTAELTEEIEKLLKAKRGGEELDRGPRIESISTFIENELARLEGRQFGHEYERGPASSEELNELFRWSLEEVWP